MTCLGTLLQLNCYANSLDLPVFICIVIVLLRVLYLLRRHSDSKQRPNFKSFVVVGSASFEGHRTLLSVSRKSL